MSKRSKPLLYSTGSVMLDPVHCGSKISYRIVKSRYGVLTCGIDLADCSRQITWELTDYNEYPSLDKIDLAIKQLTQIRDEWKIALATHRARKRIKKKK